MTTGTVEALVRYPVAAMQGEVLERSHVGPPGLLGDRAYVVVPAGEDDGDAGTMPATGDGLADFRAAYSAEPEPGAPLPPVTIEFPDGSVLRSDDDKTFVALSGVLGREVRLAPAPASGSALRAVTAAVGDRAVPDHERPNLVLDLSEDAVPADGRVLRVGDEGAGVLPVPCTLTTPDGPIELTAEFGDPGTWGCAAGSVSVGDAVTLSP